MLGDGASVAFLVWDATMPAPVLVPAAVTALHGRGLTLVDTLSALWGYYYPDEQTGGKVVWSLLRALLQQMQHSAVSGTRRSERAVS
jgi:hypothetical protein